MASLLLSLSFPASGDEGASEAAVNVAPPGCAFVDLGASLTPVLSGKTYSYQLLRCASTNQGNGHFRLRLIESQRVIDELILPPRKLSRHAVLEMSCENRKHQTSASYDIGAIGLLAGDSETNEFEVVEIAWAWRLDIATMRLSLVKTKGLKCFSPQGC